MDAGVEVGGRSVSFSASRMALQWRSLWPDFPWSLRGAPGVGRSILEAAFVEDCGEVVQYMPITKDLDERGRFPVWDRQRSISPFVVAASFKSDSAPEIPR